MILSRDELRAALDAGEIGFDPPIDEAEQLGAASIDVRLGHQFTKLKSVPGVTVSVADGLKTLGGELNVWDTVELKEKDGFGRRETLDLLPGDFILAMTLETIRVPRHMIALIEGRSTYARVGLSMHQTAPWIQPGWEGPVTLEITNQGPLTIRLTPKVDRPCQVTFFRLGGEVPEDHAYGSRDSDAYQRQRHPLVPDRNEH